MALKLFNTLTRNRDEFKPIKENVVSMYSCGPTVYDYAHIGNFRSFIFTDILKRYLKYKGFDVKHVMNITDVDDKTIRNSREHGKSLKDFTLFFENKFFEDTETLNIQKADIVPKATEHIDKIVAMIKKLIEKDFTYEKDGSIYFSISKFKDYGKLAKLKLENLQEKASGRLDDDNYEKDDARDFALWKAYKKEEDGDVCWDTELGKGRPGWHIECSAMSTKYLGNHFDIHTGGIDLVFPHHTNEIAQSECATGEQFVNYWVHCAHLIVNGEKMSKSLGNFFTLRDLVKKGYDARAIRYQLMSTHYRQQLNFTEESLKQIPNTLQKFKDFLLKLSEVKETEDNPKVDKLIKTVKTEFEASMDDDLNISGALGAIFEFMKAVNKLIADKKISKKNSESIKEVIAGFDKVLGVIEFKEDKIDNDIEELIEAREKARKDKDFATADRIRDELKEKGIILEDTPDGVRWKKA